MAGAASADGPFSLDQALNYPFITGVVAAKTTDTIAWVRVVDGVRNVWVAKAPDFTPRQLTQYTADDGQELTWLTLTADGSRVVYVRGGDHDSNWPAEGGLSPDPDSSPLQPKQEIWSIATAGGPPVKIDEGDAPAVSDQGRLAFVKNEQAWTAPLAGGKTERLFFDRGKVSELAWSPDGTRLAFVSRRGDHAFVGVFKDQTTPLGYLAPSTNRDGSPVWSPNGARIAFTRRPGVGGPPEPVRVDVPQPWSIWTADAATGEGREVWASPRTLAGSFPETDGEANLNWAAGDRLVFLAEMDGWPHLYSVSASGGAPTLLTPGDFMVEHVGLTRDRKALIFDANTGGAEGDGDRRHLFISPVDRAAMKPLTSGDGVEWKGMEADGGHIAFVGAGWGAPASVDIVSMDGAGRRELAGQTNSYPGAAFVAPKAVTWTAPDGKTVHGQLFQQPGGPAKPGVIFVHGGPPRQMLLGWHYMDYYSNSYAVNQYLAAHGFAVLGVNYRLGIGYGRAWQHPDKGGLAGASEYQDVLAGAKYLQSLPGVDPARIGIWGGSYGGFLTAMALAKNSDVFKAGVDMHGVHDWTGYLSRFLGHPDERYEQGDRAEAMSTAWASSPDAYVATWASPVLLIQGDDDRNVQFHQTVDLARRLDDKGVHYEELVLPNEIHGFLRAESWRKADAATVEFLTRELNAKP
ncbi:MAG TPA: prolyl oligopeptidase family serine peptidase [Caulobacteraceae bacterium]